MVSERAQRGLEIPSLSSNQNKLHYDDPHHSVRNKKGYIKLSSADNMLCADLVKEKFGSIDWKKFDTDLLFVYPRGGGEICTQNSMAKFINKFCRKGLTPFPAEELVIVPGVTTGADLLGQILFDSGDVVLVPAPYYYRFANDFGERGLIKIGVVPALSKCGKRTELVVERFEQAYQEGMKVGKVRAITLVNPQNPEGGYFSLEEIRPIVQWALSRSLYVVLDEIYDLTIYDESPSQPFQSATELFVGEEARNKLIWLWGLSKNFSLAGLRTAVLYTPNPIIRTACVRFLMHHLPNTTTQFIVREFINDHDWIENVFLPENLKRMRAARDQVLVELDKLDIPYLKPRAGFFVLMDLSKYLDEPTFEGERRLHQRIIKHRVIISAGETMIAPKAGWFRMVFTSVDSETLNEALHRIRGALLEQEEVNGKLRQKLELTAEVTASKENGDKLHKRNGLDITSGLLETTTNKMVRIQTISANGQ